MTLISTASPSFFLFMYNQQICKKVSVTAPWEVSNLLSEKMDVRSQTTFLFVFTFVCLFFQHCSFHLCVCVCVTAQSKHQLF